MNEEIILKKCNEYKYFYICNFQTRLSSISFSNSNGGDGGDGGGYHHHY